MPSQTWSDAGAHARGALVRLDPGDELHDSVKRWAKKHGVHGGAIWAIGAADEIELGYFRLPEKVYDRRLVKERVEVVSLMGNLAMKDGEPFLHAHGVFTGPDFTAFGGHVFRAVASITLEVFVVTAPALARIAYPEFGLSRIACDQS